MDIGDKLNIKFEEASKNYNNIMAMLPLAIDDSKQRLLGRRISQQDNSEKFIAGMLTMGEEGELKIIEKPRRESTELIVTDNGTTNALV